MDAYDQKDLPHLEKIICDLDNFRDDYYQHLHAEEVLRLKFLEHPPCGKTKADVLRMSAEDVIALDMDNDYSK